MTRNPERVYSNAASILAKSFGKQFDKEPQSAYSQELRFYEWSLRK